MRGLEGKTALVLCSNAGIEHFGPLDEITVEDYTRVFDVNVRGQLFVTQAAARAMGEGARQGIAINAIAPGGTNSDMAAENARHYTHPALRDLEPERILRTENALERLAEPEEIAAAVAFLASADASYMTGYTLQVKGGRL